MNGFNNYNGNFNNGNYGGMQDDQQQRCYVVINVADMIRETFNGIIALNASLGGNAFQQASLQQCTHTPQSMQVINDGGLGQGGFIGVYNHNAYGVYDNSAQLDASLQYIPGYSIMTFETYEDALYFAKNGIANVRGISIDDIPDMMHRVNWTQRL